MRTVIIILVMSAMAASGDDEQHAHCEDGRGVESRRVFVLMMAVEITIIRIRSRLGGSGCKIWVLVLWSLFGNPKKRCRIIIGTQKKGP